MCHRKDSTGAEEEEERHFTTQRTVIQPGSRKTVSLTFVFRTEFKTYIVLMIIDQAKDIDVLM